MCIVLQAVRKFPTGDRCRLLVSDGVHTCGFAILASQMNNLVESGEIAQHSVVQVTRYYCNDVSQKKKVSYISTNFCSVSDVSKVLILVMYIFLCFMNSFNVLANKLCSGPR